jgi:hypothetical protein
MPVPPFCRPPVYKRFFDSPAGLLFNFDMKKPILFEYLSVTAFLKDYTPSAKL